jgi:hypothetical protein
LLRKARQTFVVKHNAQAQLAHLIRGESVSAGFDSGLKCDGTLFTGEELTSRVAAQLKEDATA